MRELFFQFSVKHKMEFTTFLLFTNFESFKKDFANSIHAINDLFLQSIKIGILGFDRPN